MQEIRKIIQATVKDVFNEDIEPELTRPDEQFGDYSTNVAMQLAGKVGKNPREIAEELAGKIRSDSIQKTEVAGPGFLNITLTDQALVDALHVEHAKPYAGKTVVIEHTDPNPFKEFHIGHAYSNTIGESLGRLYKAAGADVHQVSYHGDKGLHIAKAVYGMKHLNMGREEQPLSNIPTEHRKAFTELGKAYAEGVKLYEHDGSAKEEIERINRAIYDRSDPEINKLYDFGRDESFEYFDSIYKRLHVGFEKQYFESETGPEGIKIVQDHIDDGIFEKSDGAVVFKGEKFDLHTRVFINSQGLPTYEAKELGLAFAKERDYHFDEALVVTANEIDQYFQVLLAALGEIDKDLAKKIKHVSHGMVKLPSGKMSSRTGDVITALEVLDMLEQAVKKAGGEHAQAVEDNVLGALKYTFLKHRLGSDIVFDINESISLEGNSGPYLQYAHARACSILSKKEVQTAEPDFEPDERSLVRKITEYPEVVERAVNELMPHHICTYLYELAQNFNRFYEKNRVLDDPRENIRLNIVEGYAETLKNGLTLLNIPAPEKM